jgi:hypothetical protein
MGRGLSPGVDTEAAKEAKRSRQKFWSAVGAILASFSISAFSQVQSCQADRRSEEATTQTEAQANAARNAAIAATSANIASTVTEAQMTAVYEDLTEKFDQVDENLDDLRKHLEWQEKRADLLESLILRSLGNRRAVRNYEAPPEPTAVKRAPKKALPKSPMDALQQKVLQDPGGLFK